MATPTAPVCFYQYPNKYRTNADASVVERFTEGGLPSLPGKWVVTNSPTAKAAARAYLARLGSL